MTLPLQTIRTGLVAACLAALAGCHSCGGCNSGNGDPYMLNGRHCGVWCDRPNGCIKGKLAGLFCTRSNAIPQRYPLGSVMREHFHVMQTNAEASDFVFRRHEFVGETAELTPDGRDHVFEIAARMRSAPFPVIVERSEDNANPELDAERRHLIASSLSTLGNTDADQRTLVAPSYDRGLQGPEVEYDYYRFLGTRTNTGFNNAGNNNGGFGGGGFGGGFGGR